MGDFELAAVTLAVRRVPVADRRRGRVLVVVGPQKATEVKSPCSRRRRCRTRRGGHRDGRSDLVDVSRHHIQCPAQPVVVQQRARRAQPVVAASRRPNRRRRRAARGGEAVGHQRRDHLAVPQMRPAPHRAGPIDIPATSRRSSTGPPTASPRRDSGQAGVQASERGGQIVERSRVFQWSRRPSFATTRWRTFPSSPR